MTFIPFNGTNREDKMNRHTMRKLYGISAAMLILAASLAGCGSKSSAEKAPTAPSESAAAETSAQSGGQARELSEETAASETEVKEEEAKEQETSEKETTAETTAAQTEAETAQEKESKSAEAAEKGLNKEASDEADSIPVYVISQRMLYEYDQFEGEYKQLSGSTFDCAYLTDEAAKAYPALDKALIEEAESRTRRFEEEFKLLTGECRSMIEEGYPLYAPLTANSYIHVHCADGTLFSYLARR